MSDTILPTEVLRSDVSIQYSYTAAIVAMVYDYGKSQNCTATVLEINPSSHLNLCDNDGGHWENASIFSCGYLIWWDIFSLVFIDEERKYVASRMVFPRKHDIDTLSHLIHQVILLCRVSAVYGHNNKLRIVLGTSLTLGALASIFVMSVEIPPGHGGDVVTGSAILAAIISLPPGDKNTRDQVVSGLRWIGLLGAEKATARAGIFLLHRFGVQWKDDGEETLTSTLITYVGLPCGIATQLVLDGENKTKGVSTPYFGRRADGSKYVGSRKEAREMCELLRVKPEEEGVGCVKGKL
ncbi:hypothetical protein BU17DRAFT_60104 [Hysterangium stoloniferum]|nr:hypothetical protein BU17DRAFT_60104 [Hysterangium stoloniferum]